MVKIGSHRGNSSLCAAAASSLPAPMEPMEGRRKASCGGGHGAAAPRRLLRRRRPCPRDASAERPPCMTSGAARSRPEGARSKEQTDPGRRHQPDLRRPNALHVDPLEASLWRVPDKGYGGPAPPAGCQGLRPLALPVPSQFFAAMWPFRRRRPTTTSSSPKPPTPPLAAP